MDMTFLTADNRANNENWISFCGNPSASGTNIGGRIIYPDIMSMEALGQEGNGPASAKRIEYGI
jgi:hypothetical protein